MKNVKAGSVLELHSVSFTQEKQELVVGYRLIKKLTDGNKILLARFLAGHNAQGFPAIRKEFFFSYKTGALTIEGHVSNAEKKVAELILKDVGLI